MQESQIKKIGFLAERGRNGTRAASLRVAIYKNKTRRQAARDPNLYVKSNKFRKNH